MAFEVFVLMGKFTLMQDKRTLDGAGQIEGFEILVEITIGYSLHIIYQDISKPGRRIPWKFAGKDIDCHHQ